MKALAILLAIVVNIIALCLTQCAKAGTLPCLPSAAAVRALHPHSRPTYRVVDGRRCWAHRRVSKSAFVAPKPTAARDDNRKDNRCSANYGAASCVDAQSVGGNSRPSTSMAMRGPNGSPTFRASMSGAAPSAGSSGIADPAAVWPPPPLTAGRLITYGILRLMQEAHREPVW